MQLHTTSLRTEFPQLASTDVVYLDSAATSLKPRRVIERLTEHLSSGVSNVHRGTHAWSMDASDAFERARATIARSIGAAASEIVFTHNTSASLLLLAEHLSSRVARAFVTAFEHHSNLAPWQQRYDTTVLPCDRFGRLHLDSKELEQIGSDCVVAIAHASNVTGIVQPVRELARVCRDKGALLVVDGAQSFPHMPIDVEDLGCDFFAFSPHKAFGPSGVGVLYGKRRHLQEMTPRWLGGGTLDKYAIDGRHALRAVPFRFELGTPNIEGVLGAASAVEFLTSLDRRAIAREGDALYRRLAERLMDSPRLQVLGGLTDGPYISLLTISARGVESEHLATLLADRYRVFTRAGFHCTHPLYTSLGVSGGVRLSAYVYNTLEECDRVVDVLAELSA